MAACPSAKKPDANGHVVVARNRAARHNFDIVDTLECGMVLLGSEVKSARDGHVQIGEAFALIRDGEFFVHNLHIAPWMTSSRHSGHDPLRVRKLLAHRREIDRLDFRVATERLSLVPLEMYFHNGRAKMLVGVGRGKKQVDKRRDLAERDARREAERAIGQALKVGR